MPARPDSSARRLDPVAVRAALRRLVRAEQPPWLHAEVARRMAEKLALIRHQPELVIDWWSTLGASAALLRQAYPKAGFLRVEPDAAWAARSLARTPRSWWSALRGTARIAGVVAESDHVEPGAG
ncbi:MAG: biotin synthase, partial [Burkholderiaceae bacterium]